MIERIIKNVFLIFKKKNMKRWSILGIAFLFFFSETIQAQKKTKAVDSLAIFDAYVQQAVKD